VPSLCDGWAVRDVLGHMGLGHTVALADLEGDGVAALWQRISD
jgi:Mycothiol maleylpyruvate isomerase N-terminal domain